MNVASDGGKTMRAMVLDSPGDPLRAVKVPRPRPGVGQVLVRVRACAVCRTDLHVVEGELPSKKSPIIPGHQVVGTVEASAPGVTAFRSGDRVGVAWLHHTCGRCSYCRSARKVWNI